MVWERKKRKNREEATECEKVGKKKNILPPWLELLISTVLLLLVVACEFYVGVNTLDTWIPLKKSAENGGVCWMRENKNRKKILSLTHSLSENHHHLFFISAFINILLLDHVKKWIQCCFFHRMKVQSFQYTLSLKWNSHMNWVLGVRYWLLNGMQKHRKTKFSHTHIPIFLSPLTLEVSNANTSSWSNFRIENLRYLYNYSQYVASDACKENGEF